MATGKQIDHLKSLFFEDQNRERKKLEFINDPAKKNSHILSFKGINVIYFLHTAFVENDMQAGKVFLYKAAMVNSYYHEKLNGEIFNTLDTFVYPVLSDNTSLINRYLSYERTEHPDSFSTYFGKAVQSVLQNNMQALKANIDGLLKLSTKGWAKQYSGIVTVFEGFLNNDKTGIVKGLQEIVALHEKQEQPAVVKDFINLEATTLAKLAWRKGLEIHINSELIPGELLPVKELSTFDGYEFFKEL